MASAFSGRIIDLIIIIIVLSPNSELLFAYLIDDCINKCKAKIKLSDSRSKNLRKTAAISALKAEYLSANKNNLINQMLETDLQIKKYKVHYFMNAKFFSYYASKPNSHEKVIEAKFTKP